MIKLLTKCFVLMVFIGSSFLVLANAQDGEDDFFDDEDDAYDEPFDPDPSGDRRFMPPTPGDQNPGGSPTRPQNTSNSRGGLQSPTASRSERSSDGAVSEDAVQFKLVDPPKYWKPRKRKIRYKTENLKQ